MNASLLVRRLDGALLLPWLDANAAAVVALSANTGGCGDGCTAAGCQGCRSLFAACSSGVRSFLDGLHACPLCLLQIGGSLGSALLVSTEDGGGGGPTALEQLAIWRFILGIGAGGV